MYICIYIYRERDIDIVFAVAIVALHWDCADIADSNDKHTISSVYNLQYKFK